VTRAVQIIDLLVTNPTERFTLSEVVRRTGMSLGTAHSTLAALEQSGHVSRHRTTKAYGLGLALVVAGVVALEHNPGVEAARRLIGPLAERLGSEVIVTAPALDQIIFVAHAGEPTATGPAVRDGERFPLVPPFGTVFMAWADDAEVDEWLARSPDMSADEVARCRAALNLVRTRGFAVTASADARRIFGEHTFTLVENPQSAVDEQFVELFAALATETYQAVDLADSQPFDVHMIAAPCFGPDGAVIAAICATGFAERLSAPEVLEAGKLVRDCAAVVTRHAHGRGPQ